MGAVVVAAVALVASAGTASLLPATLGAFATTMISGAVGMGISTIGGMMMGGAKPKSGSLGAEAQDRKLTLRSSVESRKIPYGLVKVSGPLALKASTGSTKEYLHLAVPMSTREVAEIGDVWFDDTLNTDTRISSFNRVKKHLGAPSQEADTDMVAEVPGWTAQHRGRGIAYIYARAKYDTTAWPNSVKSVLGLMRGVYIYDPRAATIAITSSSAASPSVITTGAAHGRSVGDWIFVRGHSAALSKFYVVGTVPGPTSLTLLDPVTGEAVALAAGGTGGTLSKMAWTHNAALCILDYLLWTDGLNANEDEVHWDSWIASANISEEQVALGASATVTANAGTDILTLSAPAPWATGLSVRLTSTGTLPAPLVQDTTYYWIRLTATTGKLAATSEDAGYGLGLDLADTGSGTHTLSCALTATVDATADSITASSPVYWHTGDGVRFLSGTTPTGLSLGTTYFWIRTGDSAGKLAATFAQAMSGTALDLADAGSGLTIARVSQPRYTCNGVVDLAKKPIDIMEQLLTCCGGVMPYLQGKYRLHAAAAGVPLDRALTESELRGNLKIRPRPPKRDIYNAVRGTFVDPAQLWQPTDFVPQLSAGYEARDGGERIYKDKELPYTTDGFMAQRLARIDLACADQGITVDYPANLSGLPIALWDVVPLSIANLGWVRKSFRVHDWKLSEEGGVDLVLQEEAPESYDGNPGEGTHADPAPNTLLANPWNVAAPTALTLASGTDVLAIRGDGTVQTRLKAAWTAPADAFVLSGGSIEIQQKKSTDSAWLPAGSVAGADTETYLLDVEDGVAYDVRLRAVNGLGAMSTWLTVSGHTVIGKTSPPPPLGGLYRQGDTIHWTYDTPPPDFAGFRVRVHAGLTRNWEKGTDYPSPGALIQERSTSASALGPGVSTIMVRPADTSGNLAASAMYLTVNLGELAPDNLVSTSDEKASGFAGAVVNGSIDGDGNLVADDTGDAYLLDGSALYLPQPAAQYLPLNYLGMSYEWSYVPAAASVPGLLYVSSSVNGEGWDMEYRRRGSGDAYLEHDDGAYLIDGSSLNLGGPTPWATIPGGGIHVGRERLDFRISTDAGSRQGVVSALAVNIDVPDIIESFEDLVILSSGTRIPITKTYRAIDYLGSITLQDDGHGATGVVVVDKNPTLGPMLAAVGASQATIDIYNLKGH